MAISRCLPDRKCPSIIGIGPLEWPSFSPGPDGFLETLPLCPPFTWIMPRTPGNGEPLVSAPLRSIIRWPTGAYFLGIGSSTGISYCRPMMYRLVCFIRAYICRSWVSRSDTQSFTLVIRQDCLQVVQSVQRCIARFVIDSYTACWSSHSHVGKL